MHRVVTIVFAGQTFKMLQANHILVAVYCTDKRGPYYMLSETDIYACESQYYAGKTYIKGGER